MAENTDVIYILRDIKSSLTNAWKSAFEKYSDRVQVSNGDIFKGAPAADAIVSPANSFGFMDGGIDMAYSMHFGWQLQTRLQKVIREEHDGEVLVGNVAIIPTFEGGATKDSMDWAGCNDGRPIKYLICAPTMRVPMEVDKTVNSYLAFRGVILAVKKHNADPSNEPIKTVLCPGLGTSVGRMPFERCALQMQRAFEMYEMAMHQHLREPADLPSVWKDALNLQKQGGEKSKRVPPPPTDDELQQSREPKEK